MKNKVVFATGMAVGFVLGSRAGRDSYEKIKNRANQLWNDPKVQEKVSGTTETLKKKAPGVQEKASAAAKKAQDRASHALHRDGSSNGSTPNGSTPEETGPSGGDPYKIEPQPFQNQADETRPATDI